MLSHVLLPGLAANATRDSQKWVWCLSELLYFRTSISTTPDLSELFFVPAKSKIRRKYLASTSLFCARKNLGLFLPGSTQVILTCTKMLVIPSIQLDRSYLVDGTFKTALARHDDLLINSTIEGLNRHSQI